ncbi:MAG: hypothetical protein LUD76_04265 [Alistipes sp.]|nr:hypothetical protein [Alistipes sp.]
MKNVKENAGMSASELVTTNVNEGTSKGNKKISGTQKRQAIPAMWRVLGRAKKTFDAQLDKNNATKLRCIEAYLTSEMNDSSKFWGEFMEQVEKLLDSRKYLRDCQHLGYDAANVAEHIVFLGSAMLNKVLKYGVQNVLGNDLMLYSEKFTPKDAEMYRERITAFLKTEQVA